MKSAQGGAAESTSTPSPKPEPAKPEPASSARAPNDRGAGAGEASPAEPTSAKIDAGAPVEAAALDTCAKLREDVEDGEVSVTACRILEAKELGAGRVEVVEVELFEPAADEVREVYVAMRDDDGWTRFVPIVQAREVPGESVEYALARLEVRGESVLLAYTVTTTTFATEGPGPTGEVDRQIDEAVVVCNPKDQECVTP